MSDFEPDEFIGTSGIIETSAELIEDEDDDVELELHAGQQPSLLTLLETIASNTAPPNPIAHWERLAWLATEGILITTTEVYHLCGAKPSGDTWDRGSFRFVREGKIGTQTSWRVYKISN